MPSNDQPANLNPTSNQSDLAAEIIRQKISSLYVNEAREQQEPNALQEEREAEAVDHRTKHQQYMYNLSHSGKSMAEIQVAWHAYYNSLPDHEKHQVWQAFYKEQDSLQKQAAEHAQKPLEPFKKPANRSVSQLKKQLLSKVNAKGASQSNLKTKHHVQSVLFGLGVGSIAVLILLFGFFNERIIAPFITPSKTVTSTPIISDASQVATGGDKVIIPKINVEIPVVYSQTSIAEKDVENSLEEGVVHYATTPSPGEQGNAVIFGHSSNNILNKGKYKFAFVLLNRLQTGDTFTLTKNGKRYVYQVYERKIVEPTEVSVLGATSKPATATLITCDPPGTSLHRLVVIGEQISPSPSTNTASTAVRTSQTPAVVPSASQSLWQRIISAFSS